MEAGGASCVGMSGGRRGGWGEHGRVVGRRVVFVF